MDIDNLLASILTPDEMEKHKDKEAKKSGKKKGTGVKQTRHTPYKLIHTKWEFVGAEVICYSQVCGNCGSSHSYTNNHVLFHYKRSKVYQYTTYDHESLDLHKTYQPRKGVTLPENMRIETKYAEPVFVGYCVECAEGEISTESLLEYLEIPVDEDLIAPEHDEEVLVTLEGSDTPILQNKDVLALLDEEKRDAG